MLKEEILNSEKINEMYEEIADELNISDAVFDSANRSYKVLGEYLDNNLEGYKVVIFPQGSMNLGTLIKPVDKSDDYDLDAVCKVYHDFDSPEDLKNLIGDVLKNSDRYSKLLVKEEGKRCWTLKYSDDANFHMDILPSMPNSEENNNSIIITHKEDGKYTFMVSNPEDYAAWFDKLQEKERRILFEREKREFSAKVEDLRKYKIRTTLQKTIQILKRHRDIKYRNASQEEKDNKPISIIITTLVGYLYTGDETILDLICKFVNDFHEYVEIDENGKYIIRNPINEEENFADKWAIYPQRKEAFYSWVEDLKKDLITNNFMIFDDLVDKGNHLKSIFGASVIESVFEKRAKTMGKKYIKTESIATLTNNETKTAVRKHNFYGN